MFFFFLGHVFQKEMRIEQGVTDSFIHVGLSLVHGKCSFAPLFLCFCETQSDDEHKSMMKSRGTIANSKRLSNTCT